MASVTPFSLNIVPHDGQMEVLSGMAKHPEFLIATIDASRGWGKTLFIMANIVAPHCLNKGQLAQVMWVAPTYKICRSPVDDVFFGIDEATGKRFIPEMCEATGFRYWDYLKGDMEIHWFNQSKIFFRSADNPDSIVSKGYSLIIIDEAAIIDQEVFEKQILPTARRQGCKIILISTPRGKNWFYHKYLDGQDSSKKNFISFKQPWWKRPNYPPILVELMKTLPKHIRDQEFGAEFIDNAGGTFANLESVFQGEKIEFSSDQQQWEDLPGNDEMARNAYVVSIDIAKSMDYTVMTVFNTGNRNCHYYRRMNKTDYKIVVSEIERLSKRYNDADVIYDATGVGSGIQDFLTVNAHPFKFTNDSKSDIVNRLIVACDYTNIHLPNIHTIREEFELFEYSLTKTGKITYSAPSGRHDDCVMSIAMANYYCEEHGGQGEVHSIDNFLNVIEGDGPTDFYKFMEEDND